MKSNSFAHLIIAAAALIGFGPTADAAVFCRSAKDCVVRVCCCGWVTHHRDAKRHPPACQKKCKCKVRPAKTKPQAQCIKRRCVLKPQTPARH